MMNEGAGAGNYISPRASDYRVRVADRHAPDFSWYVHNSVYAKVEVESISLTPSGNQPVVKPNAAAGEIDN